MFREKNAMGDLLYNTREVGLQKNFKGTRNIGIDEFLIKDCS